MVRYVPVGQVLHDPLGEGQRLDLVRGDGVAKDGSAQVAQVGYGHRGLPEPDVTVSSSVITGHVVTVPGVRWHRRIHPDKSEHFPKVPPPPDSGIFTPWQRLPLVDDSCSTVRSIAGPLWSAWPSL